MASPSLLAGEGPLSRGESRERGRQIAKLRGRAKEMRSAACEAEHRLWQLLRAQRFAGFKFRRQVPIDVDIADVLCPSARLIVELDGGQHGDVDPRRDAYLRQKGFQVLRIWNNDLFNNEEGVLAAILSALRSPPPQPLSRLGKGLKEGL